MRVRVIVPVDLPHIRSEEWVDQTRRPCIIAGTAFVPVRDGYPYDREIERSIQYKGRGFFMLGDVAVLHGAGRPSAEVIQRILFLKRPKGIILIRSIDESTRVPDCEILYGEAGEVCHKENNYRYYLDPCRLMFSQGNLTEKMRVARLIRAERKQERIADMFAGIGYFSIPMAGTGADVHAMEINPVAYNYLTRNIDINGLQERITPSLGDCRKLLFGTYDRILMGHFDAITMLPIALSHGKEGTTIHLHSLGNVENEIRMHLAEAGFSADLNVHKVKKYCPHTWHMVSDIVIT